MKNNDPIHFLKFKRGEDLPQSRLTAENVIEARKLNRECIETVKKLQSEFSAKALADRYGVHHRTMEKALIGKTWSHIL